MKPAIRIPKAKNAPAAMAFFIPAKNEQSANATPSIAIRGLNSPYAWNVALENA